MGKVDLCCACMLEMQSVQEHNYVKFRYEVPGSQEPENVLIAVVCIECFTESEDPNKFPVIEALINARVIRDQRPGLMFTPASWS